MLRHTRVLPVVLVTGIALLVGARATLLQAQDKPKETLPFEAAQIYFEFNSSAQDLGIQVFLDGESWEGVTIVDPNGKKIVDIAGRGSVKGLGLSELFFESTEPSFEDLSFDEILALFPEGDYHFFGVAVEGNKMTATATLTHDIPDGPIILSPAEGGLVDPSNTVISWVPVTTPAGIHISRYEIIVEQPHGQRVFDVAVPAKATSVTVSPEFLKPGTNYIFEVLAKEVSGNQTITEGSFETE